MTPEELVVGAAALIEAAGVTYRQMDYWVRTGRLRTTTWDGTANPCAGPGSGRERWFPESEVFVATTVAQLLAAGFVLDSAFELARDLASGAAVLTLAPGLRLHHERGKGSRPRGELPGQVDLFQVIEEAG